MADLTAELADDLGFRKAKGALITRVEPDSRRRRRPEEGHAHRRVDNQPVAGADLPALDKAAGDGVLLQVQSPREGTRFVVVKPETVQK